MSYCSGRADGEDLADNAVTPQCCCCRPPTRNRADCLTTPIAGRASNQGQTRNAEKEEAGGDDEAPSSSSSEPSPGQGERLIASCLRQGPTTL